jgi:hypothetical protein
LFQGCEHVKYDSFIIVVSVHCCTPDFTNAHQCSHTSPRSIHTATTAHRNQEHENLSGDAAYKATMEDMLATLAKYQAGEFQPNRTGGDPNLAAKVGRSKWHGYWGPFLQ